jgi:hypothetical protein
MSWREHGSFKTFVIRISALVDGAQRAIARLIPALFQATHIAKRARGVGSEPGRESLAGQGPAHPKDVCLALTHQL